jgi:WD40-like Beta Propeller Repeat
LRPPRGRGAAPLRGRRCRTAPAALGASFLVLLALLATPGPAAAAGRYAPDLTWRTRTTPHFYIHYPQGLEAFAQRFGAVAEAVYARQTARLKWEPKGRTHVVLSDQTDQANGLSTVVPYDTILLNLTPPDGDAGLELNPWDWDRLLFTHEYTHILHMDQAAGALLWLRHVFGRLPLLFPNVFNPPWMLEGLAVREETLGTEGGRGRGALFKGILRAQGAEDAVPPISKANHFFHTWPGGRAPYLYGEAFLADLAARMGPDAPLRLIPPYSDNLIPFLLAGSYHEATGEGLPDAWDAWRARVAADARAAPGGPPAGAVRLTASGYDTGGARFNRAGTALAYTEHTPNDHARILLAPEGGAGTPRELAWRNGNRDLAFAPDGKSMVFSQPELADSFRLYDDLYRADLATGRVRRLTRGARLREADVAPDGRIVAVAAGRPAPGDTSLVLLDRDAAAPPAVLLALGREAVFAQPRFAPDGRTVAVSVWRPDAGRHIALVDVATGAYRLVTAGRSNHADPAWSPDGRYLLYTDDAGGVFDLYALDLREGARWRVTQELAGAFAPAVAPDGTAIVYTRLAAGGYDLYRMPFDPAAWTPAPDAPPEAAGEAAPADPPAPVPVPAKDGPYHPYPAALPRFWLPIGYDEAPDAFYGLVTLGTDPVGHHSYLLQAAADLHERLFEGYLTYVYDRLRPSVVLTASQDIQGRALGPGGVGLGGWYRRREATLDLMFPVNRVNRRERLIVGVGRDDFGIAHLCAGCSFPGAFKITTLRLGLTHDDTHKYGLGISPTDGRRLALTAEAASDAWGSDRTGTVTVADWSEYVALPPRAQVVNLRLTGATASGSRLVAAGGAPNPVEDAFHRDFTVRGIPDRALVGDRLGRAGLAWRFPLGLPEWAPWTLPIFVEKLHGNLFAEGAQVRVARGHVKHVAGGGAEVGTDMVAGYALPVTLRAGVARGLGHRGETQFYVRVEASLL